MRGFQVVTSDDRLVGRVADVRDGYLIVESGRVRKSLRPVPREFVHAVDEAAKAFVTVPRRVLRDAPALDRRGNFDRREAARHYGLAESSVQAPAAGPGDAEIHKHLRLGDAAAHPPALLGDRRVEQLKREG